MTLIEAANGLVDYINQLDEHPTEEQMDWLTNRAEDLNRCLECHPIVVTNSQQKRLIKYALTSLLMNVNSDDEQTLGMPYELMKLVAQATGFIKEEF